MVVESASPGPTSAPYFISPDTGTPVSTPHVGPHSHSSTESLIEQSLDALLLSPMEAGPSQMQHMVPNAGYHNLQQMDITDMFSRFSEMLDRDLSNTAARITTDIKADISNSGSPVHMHWSSKMAA